MLKMKLLVASWGHLAAKAQQREALPDAEGGAKRRPVRPPDRPKNAERRRRDRRAGKARAKRKPIETRICLARLRQIRVDGKNPQGHKS